MDRKKTNNTCLLFNEVCLRFKFFGRKSVLNCHGKHRRVSPLDTKCKQTTNIAVRGRGRWPCRPHLGQQQDSSHKPQNQLICSLSWVGWSVQCFTSIPFRDNRETNRHNLLGGCGANRDLDNWCVPHHQEQLPRLRSFHSYPEVTHLNKEVCSFPPLQPSSPPDLWLSAMWLTSRTIRDILPDLH